MTGKEKTKNVCEGTLSGGLLGTLPGAVTAASTATQVAIAGGVVTTSVIAGPLLLVAGIGAVIGGIYGATH